MGTADKFGFDIKDGITPELRRLLKKSGDLTPALKDIEHQVMRPLKLRAWDASGIRSRTGELKDSVVTFHGKRSAGVSVHTSPGKDLIIPKAHTLSKGVQRHQYRIRKTPLVRAYRRLGKMIAPHKRIIIGAPFGDIQARPFVPERLGPNDERKAVSILEDFFNVRP